MRKAHIPKSLLLVAASGVLCTLASAATITGATADAEVYANGSSPGAVGNGSILAGNYYTGATNIGSAIFVFQLPTLGAGVTFSSATLNLNVALQNSPTFNADLTGLTRVDASSAVLATDYSAPSTSLQVGVLTPTTLAGAVTSVDISSWLNTQYNGGANAGQYVFLSVQTPSNPSTTHFQGYFIGSANNSTPANQPYISYSVTAVPEPATYGLMGAGALAGAALVRRRRKVA